MLQCATQWARLPRMEFAAQSGEHSVALQLLGTAAQLMQPRLLTGILLLEPFEHVFGLAGWERFQLGEPAPNLSAQLLAAGCKLLLLLEQPLLFADELLIPLPPGDELLELVQLRPELLLPLPELLPLMLQMLLLGARLFKLHCEGIGALPKLLHLLLEGKHLGGAPVELYELLLSMALLVALAELLEFRLQVRPMLFGSFPLLLELDAALARPLQLPALLLKAFPKVPKLTLIRLEALQLLAAVAHLGFALLQFIQLLAACGVLLPTIALLPELLLLLAELFKLLGHLSSFMLAVLELFAELLLALRCCVRECLQLPLAGIAIGTGALPKLPERLGDVVVVQGKEFSEHFGARFDLHAEELIEGALRQDDRSAEVLVGDAQEAFGIGVHGLPVSAAPVVGGALGPELPTWASVRSEDIPVARRLQWGVQSELQLHLQPLSERIGDALHAPALHARGAPVERQDYRLQQCRFPAAGRTQNAEQSSFEQPPELHLLPSSVGEDPLQAQPERDHSAACCSVHSSRKSSWSSGLGSVPSRSR